MLINTCQEERFILQNLLRQIENAGGQEKKEGEETLPCQTRSMDTNSPVKVHMHESKEFSPNLHNLKSPLLPFRRENTL
jgi:hypothetical protein